MDSVAKPKLDFMIIGVQKCSTSWLWRMLEQHPAMDLSNKKEIHYFGGVENYRKGNDWYYRHFADVDPAKLNGEASTSYFAREIPFWYDDSPQAQTDPSLASIPELILEQFPDIKVIIVMRDPVRRAVSAYQHLVRRRDPQVSPLRSLRHVAEAWPRKRLIEYGTYLPTIRFWQQFIPPERMHFMVFEEDVLETPDESLRKVFEFLDVDPDVDVENPGKKYNLRWSWTRTVLNYYAGSMAPLLRRPRVAGLVDSVDLLKRFEVSQADAVYLREQFLPEKPELEAILERSLDCWKYAI